MLLTLPPVVSSLSNLKGHRQINVFQKVKEHSLGKITACLVLVKETTQMVI